MGIHLADMNVNKLIAELGVQVTLFNRHRNGKYSSYKGKVGKSADNLLKQQFNASVPYQVLHTDVSQARLANHNWSYISSITDEASSWLFKLVSILIDNWLLPHSTNCLPSYLMVPRRSFTPIKVDIIS